MIVGLATAACGEKPGNSTSDFSFFHCVLREADGLVVTPNQKLLKTNLHISNQAITHTKNKRSSIQGHKRSLKSHRRKWSA